MTMMTMIDDDTPVLLFAFARRHVDFDDFVGRLATYRPRSGIDE